jgi:hypothetical protein
MMSLQRLPAQKLLTRSLLIVALVGLLLVAAAITQAQGDPEAPTCPVLVGQALETLDSNCTGLARNTACYGFNRVDATFWYPPEGDAFSMPADRIPVLDLETIATAPLNLGTEEWGLALLNIQADLPETLPGQAVAMLLMGDTSVTNTVPPEQILGPVTPVAAVTLTGANLRSRPTTTANVVTSLPAATTVSLVGVDETREWYEIMLDSGGTAWIFGDLVSVMDFNLLTALPITDGAAGLRYGPMQAFYFTTGLGDPTCAEAPDAMVIQSTELAEVTLNINALEIELGSTVVLTTAPDTRGTGQAMVMALVEGELNTNVNGFPVSLRRGGQAIAITLNEQGLVDNTSRLTRLSGDAAAINTACRIAAESGQLEKPLTDAQCSEPVTYYVPPPPPTAVPATPTPVGPSISFVADRTSIGVEECVTLSWAVENVQAVYYQGRGVSGQGSSQECPPYDTTYRLMVVTQSGEQIERTIPITVEGGYYVNFYAATNQVMNGECTTITWDTGGVQEVYFEGDGVTGNQTREVCPIPPFTPPADVVYTLEVVLRTGERLTYTETITVN